MSGRRSTSATRAPRCAYSRAAVQPATLAPTTTTSKSAAAWEVITAEPTPGAAATSRRAAPLAPSRLRRPMHLAVQLYTLRHRLEQDLEGTLAQLAEAGASEVELAGLYGRTAADMRAALDAAGLTACAAHVPLEQFEAFVEDAATVGVPTLVVPWVEPPE